MLEDSCCGWLVHLVKYETNPKEHYGFAFSQPARHGQHLANSLPIEVRSLMILYFGKPYLQKCFQSSNKYTSEALCDKLRW